MSYEKKHDHHHHKTTVVEEDKEITALLVNYNSPRAKFSIPGIVNNKEQLMAAEPSIEIQRLLDLVQPAVKVIAILAWFIFGLAFFSMLITMINSMKDRKYEIAMMRASGATSKLVLISILTEVFNCFYWRFIGSFMGHILLEIMGQYLTNQYHYQFSGLIFNFFELWLLIGTIAIGIISAFIPAIAAYNMDISSTLKRKYEKENIFIINLVFSVCTFIHKILSLGNYLKMLNLTKFGQKNSKLIIWFQNFQVLLKLWIIKKFK